jgi:hypothetical protein
MLAVLVCVLCLPMTTISEAVRRPVTTANAPGLLNGLKRQPIRIGIGMTILLMERRLSKGYT